MDKQILILTNSILPYSIHNVSYLAIPSGLTYHFRYRAKYFESDIWGDRKEWGKNLTGVTGLLVLRDWETATFIPLRRIRVHAFQDYGEFVFLELEFLNYVVYPELKKKAESGEYPTIPTEVRRRVRETYHNTIAQLIPSGLENKPKKHMSNLIIGVDKPISGIELDQESDARTTLLYWYQISELLAELPAFQGVSFYRIAELTKTDSPTRPLLPVDLTQEQKGYRLTSGENYTLRLLQTIPSESQSAGLPFEMELQSNEQHIVAMRNAEIVDGIYDQLTYYFNVLPQAKQKTKSFVFIESKQHLKFSDHSGAWPPGTYKDDISVPANFISVDIFWPWWIVLWRWVLPPLAFILAILLWFGAGWFIKVMPFFASFGITIEIVHYAAIFLLALAFQNWSTFTGQFNVPSQSKP